MNPHEPGELLARRYRLLAPIADTETSILWRARDEDLDRLVAVKIMQDHRELARKEARTTARLAHADAIEVYDYGETVTAGGRVAAYVVMRLLDGRPLAERLAEGPLPWRRAAAITARIARVLAAAHRQGIVHRDVTAENVLLTDAGPKLLDFGIAARTGDPDDARGTPSYVAPERLTGAPANPAVDVYALGVLFFQLLTGGAPYPETTWEELERASRRWPAPRPAGVRADLADLCQRCLAPAPAIRPSAQDVADRLARALARSRATRTVRRSLALGALLLAVSALALLTPIPDRPAAAPPVTATATPTGEPASDLRFHEAVQPRSNGTFRAEQVTSGRSSGGRGTAERFAAVLSAGARAGQVRPDVALDLRQTLAHADGRAGAAELRRKIGDREREGGLSPALAARLRGVLA